MSTICTQHVHGNAGRVMECGCLYLFVWLDSLCACALWVGVAVCLWHFLVASLRCSPRTDALIRLPLMHTHSLELTQFIKTRTLAVSTIGVGGVRDGRTDARNAEASMYETKRLPKGTHTQTHTRGTVRGGGLRGVCESATAPH